MAHELSRNLLFRKRIERKLTGRGSYRRGTKHKGTDYGKENE